MNTMKSRCDRAARLIQRYAALGLVAIVALAGCGSSDDVDRGPELSAETVARFNALPPSLQTLILTPRPAPVSFVGSVDDTETYVGVATSGDSAQVYVCDGQDVAIWLLGTADGSGVSASDDAASVTASVSGASLTGTVTIGGVSHSFFAARAEYPADLWESLSRDADGQLVRGGWIVLADGTQRGAVKQGLEIVSTESIDPPADDGSDGAVTPVPSEPVPFQKKVKTKVRKPSVAAQCASLSLKLGILLSAAGDAVGADGTVSPAGVAAAEEAARVQSQMQQLNCKAVLAGLGQTE
jgi:hypothetical protein